jgi:hypothetical protein
MMTSNYFKSQLRKFDSGKHDSKPKKPKPTTPSKPKAYLKDLSQKKDALFVQLGICERKCYFFQEMRDENRNLYLAESNEVVGSWKFWEVDERENDDVNVSQDDCIQMEQEELILFEIQENNAEYCGEFQKDFMSKPIYCEYKNHCDHNHWWSEDTGKYQPHDTLYRSTLVKYIPQCL